MGFLCKDMNKFLVIIFLVFYLRVLGQVPKVVNLNGDTLSCAFAGGLNAPQFSNIDVNSDGKQDLFVFDRSDNKVMLFVNEQGYRFSYSKDYSKMFPNLGNWALLRDYNCDGKPDIYTSVSSYIRVYENTSSSTGLNFTVAYDTLESEYFGGTVTYLYSSRLDIPAIVDVDYDGDLDIVVWELLSGVKLEYHKNLSVEQGLGCGNILMKKVSSCFGHFHEFYDPTKNSYTAILNDPPCGPGQRYGESDRTNMHSGGTVMGLNLNGDTLMDFVISDNGPWDLIGLINGGSRSVAHFVYADTLFPRGTAEAKLYFFPAAFYVDVDGDNTKELLISPNDPTGANYNNVWLYENTGVNVSPLFNFIRKDFLVNQMIDVGSNSAPAVFDYEGDGDYDIIIANGRKILDDASESCSIMLLENKGTNANPVFEVISEDLLQFNNYAHTKVLREVVPTFGDLDGDGDEDLIFGEENGTIWYYKNVAQANSPAIFAYQQSANSPFNSIDVGENSAPALYDIDNDGDLDLFIGNRAGYIYAYENIGDSTNPQFSLVDQQWGNIHITHPYISYLGNVQPMFFDIDFDNDEELLVGNVNGNIVVYDNFSLQAGVTFIPTDTIEVFNVGNNSKVAAYKVSTDSAYLFIGNQRGGIIFDIHNFDITSTKVNMSEDNITLYPNPTKEYVKIGFLLT